LQLSVGDKPGPVYFYWHGSGSDSTEVERGLPGVTSAVASVGGIVASFSKTNAQGTDTGVGVWYTGDFDAADQIVACGVQAGLVDTRRIYVAGQLSGGLQACAMIALRSRYLAAGICYSGGSGFIGGTPEDPSNLPTTLLLYGTKDDDGLGLNFAHQSALWAADYTAAGGFVIDCNDGPDSTSRLTRLGFGGRALPFLEAHTFNVKPEPYAAGLPTDWPSYCKIRGPLDRP
jgi:poly(3-hydroxybutyrate) depolymerase